MRIVDGQENLVISRDEALKRAREAGLDLIEVSENTDPPVVKIADLRKFIYDQDRKKGVSRTYRNAGKEIRFSPNIGQNDLQLKVKKIREFLTAGQTVKVTIKFRGREIVHFDVGEAKLKTAITAVEDIGKVEGPLKRFGSFVSVIVIPK